MANTNTVIDMVAREALRLAHEKSKFIGTIKRDYDDSFAKTGFKIGNTLRVRNPNQYFVSTTSRVMDVQDQNSDTQTITVANQYHVDMRFNSAELSLEIDEMSNRYIEPAMAVLMSRVDGECLAQATKDTYNVVGTAGTPVGTVTSGFSDTSALGFARARLNQGLAPDANRAVQLDSVTMAYVANGIKGIFTPQKEIDSAFREGFIARNSQADWYENDRTWAQTYGSDVTGTTDAASLVTDGGVTVDIHTTVAVAAQVVGQVFTIAGVYACHPETKQSLGYLMPFTTVSIGASVTTVSPATYLGLSQTTLAKRNVCKADGTALALTDFDSKTLTFFGAAGISYRNNLMYHKDAFTFVTADLPLMDGAEKCVRRNQDGIALRVWSDGDIRNDELLMRIDLLWGYKTLRPAWACRITN